MTLNGAPSPPSATLERPADTPPRSRPWLRAALAINLMFSVPAAYLLLRDWLASEPAYSTAQLALLMVSALVMGATGVRLCKRSAARRSLAVVLLASAAAIGARLATLQGFTTPVRIFGPSMAPALLGEHFEHVCADCGYRYAFDAAVATERARRIVCPNCGFAVPFDASARVVAGERVLIDRAQYWFKRPQRYDVVAARSDEGPLVKRIVALPGEQLTIDRGELLIDNRWQRKSLDEFRRTAVLVHDNAFAPQSPDLPERWTITRSPQAWNATYHSWRCYDNPLPRNEEVPISDHDLYNQGLSRNVNGVRDVMLAARLNVSGDGQLEFVYHSREAKKKAVVDFNRRTVSLVRGETLVSRGPMNLTMIRPAVWEFAVFDGQMMLALNGRIAISSIVESTIVESELGAQPFSIQARELAVTANRLQVWRDIYYLNPLGLSTKWVAPRLSPEEYLILGDNPPLSRDGRHWGGLSKDDLLGKIVRWK